MQIYADILKRQATITASQTPSTVPGGLDPRTPTGIGAYVPGMVHVGIDFAGKIGDPVYAPYDARVWIGTQASGKWPNGTSYPAAEYLLLTDADGYGLGLYHMDKIDVRSGQVKAGQRIGTIGTKGKATGPHLHAQVYKAGVCVDVYWYLFNKNKPAAYRDWDNTDEWEKVIAPKRYRVATGGQSLRIRRSPGTDKPEVGHLPHDAVFSIDRWAELPDGQIWARLQGKPWHWICVKREAVYATAVADWPERLTDGYYYVRSSWADAKSQTGAFRILKNARTLAEKRGQKVFDPSGVEVK